MTPPGGHETNLLTKFHEDWANNVSSRLFTCFHYIHIEKTSPTPGSHVFPPIMTIFELVRDIYKINAKNMASRVNMTPPPPPGGHETNVLNQFHEDWTKNVSSRKTAPPPGGHVFSPIWTIFEFVRDINETKIHIRNTAPPPGSHVFQLTETIFELNQHIIKTNILTNYMKIGHQIFELGRVIIGTNVLTKFHEDQTKKCKILTTHDGRQAIPKAHHEHVVLR
ncbi:hypothetical protein DPMN_061122 [Dreissena polymorpha]|uniref:Uncharacterized protein n=1 Tax=Dreissena polymorpha TaxID=45954 RepID=A0A9D4C7C7_DREPO|nr:hypothetical protein DPMN_061122 [Dreissena polymorpha]